MKTTLHRLAIAVVLATTISSCTTAYDAYGRPQQVVEPGAAVLGAAAVGLLAYGLSNSGNHHHYRNDGYRNNGYRDNGYYRSSYHQPYRNYSRYNRGNCGY